MPHDKTKTEQMALEIKKKKQNKSEKKTSQETTRL